MANKIAFDPKTSDVKCVITLLSNERLSIFVAFMFKLPDKIALATFSVHAKFRLE